MNWPAITTATAARKAAEIPSPGSGAAIPSIRGPMYLVCESVAMEAQPRAISSIPSVTMKDGIDQPTLTSPLAKPQTRPALTPSAAAAHTGHCQSTMATPSRTAPNASTEPTDKSMPPTISTSVIPTAITVRSGLWLATVASVWSVKKWSHSALNRATRKNRTKSRPR